MLTAGIQFCQQNFIHGGKNKHKKIPNQLQLSKCTEHYYAKLGDEIDIDLTSLTLHHRINFHVLGSSQHNEKPMPHDTIMLYRDVMIPSCFIRTRRIVCNYYTRTTFIIQLVVSFNDNFDELICMSLITTQGNKISH